MTLPTAEKVTLQYLYGADTVPESLVDDSILVAKERENILVDFNDYMKYGPGRFVSAASFDFIDRFFSEFPLDPGTYTKAEIFNKLGVADEDNSFIFNNLFYGVEDEDYVERTYIWGTVGFAVSNNTRFIVEKNNARRLEDFSAVPLQMVKSNSRENFDFTGGIFSEIGNTLGGLYDLIDSSRIGQRVNFVYSDELDGIPVDSKLFNEIKESKASYQIPDPFDIRKFWQLSDRMFAEGITRYMYSDKPIIFDKEGRDYIEGDIANYDRLDFHLASHRNLGQYVKNGIVYVAGDGNDTINATDHDDILLGGGGADTLNGKDGNDYLEGGADDDTLDGGSGFNTLDGGKGTGDVYLFEDDFGDAVITDVDGGVIRIAGDSVAVRRIDGKPDSDGTFLFVDAAGKALPGKEGWIASVSGSTLTLQVTNEKGDKHSIMVNGFSWENIAGQFGMTVDDKPLHPPTPVPVSLFDVADGKQYMERQFNPDGTDPLQDQSINYNAADFLYHFGARLDASGKTVLGPQPADAAMTYRFDGYSQADVLHGNDWLTVQQQQFDKDKPETYQQLRYFNGGGVADSTTWVGDWLCGNDGDDIITGDGRLADAVDYAQVGDRDVLIGGKGSDQIYGGAGDDVLFGWQSYTAAMFGSLQGLAFDGTKYSSIQEALYQGAVTIEAREESNVLDGGSGNDVIAGASYRDIISGGQGNDYIMAGAGTDIIAGGDGNDVVYADSFVVQSASGNLVRDFIAPDVQPGDIPGDDFYARAYFYRKDKVMDELFDPLTAYNDVVDGGEGNDYLFGEIGSDNLAGGGGDDSLFGDRPFSGGYFRDGAAGFQNLSSRYHGDDTLDGGTGADRLIGGGGSDRLSGGEGDDVMYGDVGLAVYDLKADGITIPGDKADAIRSSDAGWWGDDVLFGGAGRDEMIGEGGADMLDGGEGDDLLFGDWSLLQGANANDDGARWGNDTLSGGNGDDTLMGNGGDDYLQGGNGDDQLFGDNYQNGGVFSGKGNDVLEGGLGNDALYGGDGHDRLVGGAGADRLAGGEGNDEYDFVSGGADVVDDRVGTSTFLLGVSPYRTVMDGSNTCIYLSLDGSDRIQLDNASFAAVGAVYAGGEKITLTIQVASTNVSGNDYLVGTREGDVFALADDCSTGYRFGDAAGNNILQFSAGWQDDGYLAVTVYRNNLLYGYQDDYKLWNHASATGVLYAYKGAWDAAAVQLDDGSVARLHITGNGLDNTIHGKAGDDLVEGEAGADTLYGDQGNDTLRGGQGNDVLYGEAGNDCLYADDGHDKVYGNAGDDVLYADGFDQLDGGDGNDTLFAAGIGIGMQGGAGADTFNITGCATGSSVSIDDNHYDAGDVIQLDVNASQVHVDAGILRFYAADGVSALGNLFCVDNLAPESLWDSLQDMTIRFADGETWDAAAMRALALQASADADYMVGDAMDNLLAGGDSNDILYGCAGNDVLQGGTGDDWLCGGAGNDVYCFGKGQGTDVLRDHDVGSSWTDETDVIRFDSSVVESDVRLNSAGADVLVTLVSTGDNLRLQDFLETGGGSARHLSLAFANGASWDMARINRELFRHTSGLAPYGTATAANNTISGNAAANFIDGDAGNDVLAGNGGNDWLDGGVGNDTLSGGAGADTVRFGRGAGQDLFKDAAAEDRVRLDGDVGIADLTIEVLAASNQLRIGLHNAEGAVTDAITTGNALGHLVDSQGREVVLGNDDSPGLLVATREELLGRTVMLTRQGSDDRYTVLSAADVLGDGITATEAARWQLVAASPAGAAGFGKDLADFDGDGNTVEPGFFLVENLFGDGINRLGFLPDSTAGNAAFQFTLRRDDGLTLVSTMAVAVQSGSTLGGTAGDDILDGGQSDLALQINAAAGDDLIRDGYGNDVIHAGAGNDWLSHNWPENGNDVYFGEAGNDVLDAGWGNDTLDGGSGDDCYIESDLWCADHTVIDNRSAAAGDVDTLQIGDGHYGTADYRALWFATDGDDLLVSQLGAEGDVRVLDWFNPATPAAQLDTIRVVQDDGAVYEAHADAGFAALLQAMAACSRPDSVASVDPSLADAYSDAWQLVTPAAA